MRELKFRAWGIDGTIGPKMWAWERIYGCFDMWINDPNAKVMQYTGLKDKNGVEIYEGDIIEGTIATIRELTMGVITYDIDFACFANKNDAGSTPLLNIVYIDVIGNVYENPELVEGE